MGRDVPRIASDHGSIIAGPIRFRGPCRRVMSRSLVAGQAAVRVYRVVERPLRIHGWLFTGVGVLVSCLVAF